MNELMFKMVVIYYLGKKNLGEEIKVRKTWKEKQKDFCLTVFTGLTPKIQNQLWTLWYYS